jgi:phosphopentomutase
MANVRPIPIGECVASFGRCRERAVGKDTTSGHWEMSGVVVERPFATFPEGFPTDLVERFVREAGIPGVLGNCAASGTEIITRLGEEHLRTGKPILYTSADSVFQLAAHEEAFGLERLYKICEVARRIVDEVQISRVIARPFVGTSAKDFKRTHHRKDFSQTPPGQTAMELARSFKVPTIGVGKIWNIFNGAGLDQSIETHDNSDGLKAIEAALRDYPRGLIFVNLVDFDMIYGHRRDSAGFARALEEFDTFLPRLEQLLTPRDLVLVTADHGIDPTYRGTDHTREYVPLLAYMPGVSARDLGTRDTYADVGQTALHALTGRPYLLRVGRSVLREMKA